MKAKLAESIDQIGYDAVYCGSLADSWKEETDISVNINAYVSEIPEGMTKKEGMK